jgi:hypothetical protein
MTANDSNKKMEETLGIKDKLVNDDYQVVTDDRGYYKLGDKWLVKVRRLKLKEVISGWNVIFPVFGGKEMKDADLENPLSWLQLFALAATVQPGPFYNFLIMILEPQYQFTPDDGNKFKKEVDEFHNFVRRNLEVEELRDIIYILFKQEENRFKELIDTVKKMFAPMLKQMGLNLKNNK